MNWQCCSLKEITCCNISLVVKKKKTFYFSCLNQTSSANIIVTLWHECWLGASCRRRGVSLMKASTADSRAVTGKWHGSALSAWDATHTVPLAPTIRIHCVLQSTSPSPVPLSFFSSVSSSCSRVKISLGFLYWRRERRQRFACTFSSSPSCKSLHVLALLKGQDKENTEQNLILERGWDINEYYIVLLASLSNTRIWMKTIEGDTLKNVYLYMVLYFFCTFLHKHFFKSWVLQSHFLK